MCFPGWAAQTVLGEAGALVDAETGVVKIPAQLVDDALAAAPAHVLLAGRDPSTDLRCGAGEAVLSLDGTSAYTLDHHTGERRPSTVQDLADALRVADATPEVGIVWSIVNASDLPPSTQVLHELETCLRSTGKHVQGEVQRADEVPYVMAMLSAASDDGAWILRGPSSPSSTAQCPRCSMNP